jgi:flagellar biosynthesis anti-sigma factor FlgM
VFWCDESDYRDPKVYPLVHITPDRPRVTLNGEVFGVDDSAADMPMIPLAASKDNSASSGSEPDEPKPAVKIQALLDQIRALDKSMDEARTEKIANIKKALADGTYHVSAAEVARKIIDDMREP